MTRKHLLMLAALVALTATPALAELDVGADAPEISASGWYNLPKGVKSLKASHLKGQIVMLEFWTTW